ncbi:hypothetical protein ACPXCE_19650 [Streptomyces sp. DT24]|uniref:hypothetical protein n=1 Tax=Streptomyces sp. DT24 TaxID=3416520 RepID=UPI003CF25410
MIVKKGLGLRSSGTPVPEDCDEQVLNEVLLADEEVGTAVEVLPVWTATAAPTSRVTAGKLQGCGRAREGRARAEHCDVLSHRDRVNARHYRVLGDRA